MKTIFKNLVRAILVMLYFITLNFAYTRMNLERLIGDIEVFSGVFLVLGLLALEKSYKEEKVSTAITAIELMALSMHSLSIMNVITMMKYDFRTYLLTSSSIIAIYYVFKLIDLDALKGKERLVYYCFKGIGVEENKEKGYELINEIEEIDKGTANFIRGYLAENNLIEMNSDEIIKLYQEGIEQAKKLKIEVKKEEVLKIELVPEGFMIKTSNLEYIAKAVILATGNKKNKPKIPGIEKLEGKGISYCAICDGFFYRNKSVAVLGNGDYAISETNDLINIANDITILTNGKKKPEFRADNVKIDTRVIKEISGEKKVEQIEFEDGTRINVNGIFIAQGVAGSTEFAKKLGAITSKDKIVVNEKMETNIKGLYACGDCTGGLLQISKAVYEGAIAGIQTSKYLKMGGI